MSMMDVSATGVDQNIQRRDETDVGEDFLKA
jgi:hypothetical protein